MAKISQKRKLIHQNNVDEFKDYFNDLIDEYDMIEFEWNEVVIKNPLKRKGIGYIMYVNLNTSRLRTPYDITEIRIGIFSFRNKVKESIIRETIRTEFKNLVEHYEFSLYEINSYNTFNFSFLFQKNII